MKNSNVTSCNRPSSAIADQLPYLYVDTGSTWQWTVPFLKNGNTVAKDHPDVTADTLSEAQKHRETIKPVKNQLQDTFADE